MCPFASHFRVGFESEVWNKLLASRVCRVKQVYGELRLVDSWYYQTLVQPIVAFIWAVTAEGQRPRGECKVHAKVPRDILCVCGEGGGGRGKVVRYTGVEYNAPLKKRLNCACS